MANRAFADAATRLVGTPFRLHGRDPAIGLDCVGVISAALEAIGRDHAAPCTYALRNRSFAPFRRALAESGFAPCEGEAAIRKTATGDVLVAQPSPAQFHLLVAIDGGHFVHAHAGLGRVVRTPAPLPWPVIGHWRLSRN